MAIRIICAAVLISSLSTAALAQPSDAFDACASVQDSAARVACFDRAVAARHAAQSTPSQPPAAVTAAPPPTKSTDSTVGLDARQVHKLQQARGEAKPPPPAPITARLVRIIPRQPLISAFELDNGQVWEQVESMKLAPEPQELVTIRPGLLGAFFLKTAAGAVVRVHRLR